MKRELGASVLGLIAFLGPRIEVAHGPTNLAKGSLLSVHDDEIVVVTGSGRMLTITIAGETRFRYESGAIARKEDMSDGDPVAVDVQTIGGSHVAEEVRLKRVAEPRGANP